MEDQGALVASHHGLARSGQWRTARKSYLANNPYCKACDQPTGIGKLGHAISTMVGMKSIQVHHLIPFHFGILLGRPDIELDQRNLIGLCETGDNHHLLLGHLDDFRSYNPNLIDFIGKYHGMTPEQIKADKNYVQAIAMKPKEWAEMTAADKTAMRDLIDQLYPLKAA